MMELTLRQVNGGRVEISITEHQPAMGEIG